MVHLIESVKGNYPKTGTYFESYLRPYNPKLNTAEVRLDLLIGSERASLTKTGYGGDASLWLSYKGHGGAIACFELIKGVLSVIQFKEVHSTKGYRIHSGLAVPDIFADELANIALTLPGVETVNIPEVTQGIEGARDIETALARNRTLSMLVDKKMAK